MDDIYLAILVCSFLLGVFAQHEVTQSKKRYQKLEHRYNELAEKTGHAELSTTYISAATLDEIRQLKAQGKLVQAVKLVRSVTEMELLEAKEYVDRL